MLSVSYAECHNFMQFFQASLIFTTESSMLSINLVSDITLNIIKSERHCAALCHSAL